MTDRQKQVGRTENEARAANEVVSVKGERDSLEGTSTLAVLCECGDSSCHDPVEMTVHEYEMIRAEPAHFAVLKGHEILDCEHVVDSCDRFLTVQKFGPAGGVAKASDPRYRNTTCRVVVVDDIPEIRYLLKMLIALEPSCTVVGEASNGAEAIELVDDLQPELVVLDLEMPVMDGWDALPHIRRVSPSSYVIVFSSSEVDARLEKRLKNIGAARFIRKGGDPAVVMKAIRDVSLSGRDRVFAADDGNARA